MSQLNLENVINVLKEFSKRKDLSLNVILLGGLALYYYGLKDRVTVDIDAEVVGDIDMLSEFLKSKGIPSDIGNDISRWSIISMPPGYRDRATTIYHDKNLKIKVLAPLDFVIAKLRRFTEQDLEDALFVVRKFKITSKSMKDAAQKAIDASPRDTALLVFKKNLNAFIKSL